MIERVFIKEKTKELRIKEYLEEEFKYAGYSKCEIQKTPLGFHVIIYSARPGLVVGRGGSNIIRITQILKDKFGLDNPTVEVREVDKPYLDPQVVAERIGNQLERYGVSKFKAIGYQNLQRIMDSGAIGAEIIIGGKVPGKRAKHWKFRAGYIPKCGEHAKLFILRGKKQITLKPGVVGITVMIYPPWAPRPDEIHIKENIELEKHDIKNEGNKTNEE